MPRASRAVAMLALAIPAMATAVAAPPAAAMQFNQEPAGDAVVAIVGRGEIIKGDFARLGKAIAAVPAGKRVALLLDSPGGLVLEAEKMGHAIRDRDLPVVIPADSKCVSACFLLFAAANRRFAASDALIGVHSASENGEETLESAAVTTLMARIASDFDVPPVILGKMVRTVPGRVEWLTHDDLLAMGVKFIDSDDSATRAQPKPKPAAPPAVAAPAARPAPPAPGVPRLAEAPLPPLRPPPPSPPAQTQPPAAAVAVFQGVYFCGAPTTLSLTVLSADADGRRRAVAAFGPTATNPQAGRGSFGLAGRLDLDGGVIDLQPLAAAAPTPDTGVVGLVGRSDDGGKTFAGRVTTRLGCTLFTLKRVR